MGIVISIVYICLGAYLLYCALSQKSKVLYSRYVKKGKEEQYKKTAKIGLICNAAVLFCMAVVTILSLLAGESASIQSTYGMINNILLAVMLTALMGTYLLLARLQNKKGAAAPRPVAPRAAFIFDEEEDKTTKSPPTQNKRKR